jgi:hypothetical protein
MGCNKFCKKAAGEDWRHGARLWRAVAILRQRLLMREQAQLVPVVHERDRRADVATLTSRAAPRADGRTYGPTGATRLREASRVRRAEHEERRLMDLKLHANATATPCTHAYIQQSSASHAMTGRRGRPIAEPSANYPSAADGSLSSRPVEHTTAIPGDIRRLRAANLSAGCAG